MTISGKKLWENMKKIFKIEEQGAPVINSAYTVKQHDDVVLIELDMKSKYCDVNSGSSNEGCFLFIQANEESLYLHKRKPKDSMTTIIFPMFKGFDVFALYSGRYTIRVCLFKRGE